MSNPQEPSPPSPSTPLLRRRFYQTLLVDHSPDFRRVCLTILFERWAAFILISTVAVMLCERFGLSRPSALRLWGFVSAASYFGSLPGGPLLDRTAAPRRGIGLAALLLIMGYVALSIPLRASLYVALAFLVIGHSLFRPSTQRMIAAIYPTGDRRLESAQILLYFTANIGAAAGSLLAGLLTRYAGWDVTYAAAALLMGLGLLLLSRIGTSQAESPRSSDAHEGKLTECHSVPIPNRGSIIMGLTLAMFLFSLCTAQMEGAILLWAKDRIDRVLIGFTIPMAWFLTFPAVLVLLLTPVHLALLPKMKEWFGLSRLIAMGLLAAAASFAVLLPTTLWPGRVNIAWLESSLFCFVIAELLIAPLGLSLLLRCIPKRFVGAVTGLWYGAGALGYYVGGEIGALWSRWPTQRVLLLLSLLPLCGAALLWRVRPPQGS